MDEQLAAQPPLPDYKPYPHPAGNLLVVPTALRPESRGIRVLMSDLDQVFETIVWVQIRLLKYGWIRIWASKRLEDILRRVRVPYPGQNIYVYIFFIVN